MRYSKKNYRSNGYTFTGPEARFSKVPIINRHVRLLFFTCKIEVSIVLHLTWYKLSLNETKWSTLLSRTRALILYISIWISDFGPEKLPGLSRNGPLTPAGLRPPYQIRWHSVRLNFGNFKNIQGVSFQPSDFWLFLIVPWKPEIKTDPRFESWSG